MTRYILYSDWACSGNPWPWWWGAVVLQDNKILTELSWFVQHTTNNQMELTWTIQWIKWICEKEGISMDTWYTLELFASPDKDKNNQIHLDIYTDSVYVQKWITEYIKKWRINWRRTTNKKPIANIDLWIELDRLDRKIDIVRHWVKGHNWNHYNELVDQLATKSLY